MSSGLLMPKATAVWLVDNTALTFDQIADFCTMHPLEIQGIADGEVAVGIKAASPLQTGQLTKDQITEAEEDTTKRMKINPPKVAVPNTGKRRGPRYTPVSKRHDRPNAILWLVRNHEELKDAQIMRLVGTTKPTIESVRERSHWNAANQTPMDPVTLGLCSQIELDFEVRKAAKANPEQETVEEETMLIKAADILAKATPEDGLAFDLANAPQPTFSTNDPAPAPVEETLDAESVFSGLSSLKDKDDKE